MTESTVDLEDTVETTEEDETLGGLLTPEALSNAQKGIFDHTMLEMWESSLQALVMFAEEPLALEVAQSILTTYPWLKHDDLQPYMADRSAKFRQALEVLTDVLGDNRDKIFSENEDDWAKHSELYIEVLAGWKKLTERWATDWAAKKAHRVTHATIIDVTSALLSPEFGIMEGIRNLKDFDMTEELRTKLDKLAG